MNNELGTAEDLPVVDSCLRNQRPILDVLGQFLPKNARVLEIGSGTGQHAAYMTEHLPGICWQPTEMSERLDEITLWQQHCNRAGFLPPLELDVCQDIWPARDFDAVFSANVVHFVSWPEVERLFVGVARCLNAGGLLMLYGPYNYDGQFTSEGNIALDGWLRERNPESGIKDFEQVLLLARKHHLHLRADEEMPSNNRMLVFQKADTE